jgi:acyl carrier protein
MGPERWSTLFRTISMVQASTEEIIEAVRSFLLREFLRGHDPQSLTNSTRLLKSHLLDSLSTVKLVSFLEERYQIEILPHEIDAKYLDTLPAIAALVQGKLGRPSA